MDLQFAFNASLVMVMLCSVLWVIAQFFNIESPVVYGRHDSGQNRLGVPTRLSWILMEAPACLVFVLFFFSGPLSVSVPMLALFAMWQLHYFHRAFIYPFQLKVRPGSTTPLRMTLSGAFFCTLNGFTNGAFMSNYAEHLQSIEWLSSWQFVLGTSLFFLGYALNKISDAELMRLRKANPDAYSIPYKGAYQWVSCPNYLGELITWVGFAIAAWSIAGAVFAFMTASNLIFRALENHQWYLEKFADYPKDRKAMIPFIL